jgi:hypothetical protein
MKLLAVAIVFVLVRQDEKITLKFSPKKGDKLTKTQKMDMRIKATVEAGGQEQEVEFEQKAAEKTIHEIAEVTEGKVTRLVIDCQEDYEEKKQPPTMEWTRTDKPMHGRKVTLSLKDGQIVREGVEGLDEKHQRKLNLEDRTSHMFPKHAVGVGDKWEIKGEDLRKFLEDQEELKEGTFKLKVQEIKEIDKRRCAVLKAEIELKGKIENGIELGVKMEGEVVVWIDRGYTLSFKVKGNMTMKADTEQFTMKGEGPMTVEITTKVE